MEPMINLRLQRSSGRARGLEMGFRFAVVTILCVATSSPAIMAQRKADRVETLMARVNSPSQAAIAEFKKAGMQDVTPHALTADERTKVEAALAALPSFNRRVLEKKLHSLTFVDGIPGEGTGLTSPDANTGLYDITLRASVVDEPFSMFLTAKERRVYKDDGSGTTVMGYRNRHERSDLRATS